MILTGGHVMDGDFTLKNLDVEIGEGIISKMGESLTGADTRDVSGCYVLPGFIDTHIHGA